MKKTLVNNLTLFVLLVVTLMSAWLPAQAKEYKTNDVFTVDGIVYIVRSSGNVAVYSHKLRSGLMEIPEKVKGRKVVGICGLGTIATRVSKISIPRTVKFINSEFSGDHRIKISVDKANKYFCSKDGMLLSKDKKSLYFATYKIDKGIEKTDAPQLTIPKYIKHIKRNALSNMYTDKQGYIKKIILPKGLKTIGEQALAENSLVNVHIPSTVTSIGKKAFYSSLINYVIIPKSVKTIGKYAFGYDYSIGKIKSFRIKGYKDTAAQKYAKKYKFTFKALA